MSFDLHPVNRLNALGAPELVTADPQKLLDAAVARFEAETGRRLSPSQVEMYLLEDMAYMLSVRGAEEQLALENNFVAYARPEWLERIGAGRGTPRLQPVAASVMLRFSVNTAPTGSSIRIPGGTRVGDAGGLVQFATRETVYIGPGETSADIRALATRPGIAANGFPPGSLTGIIDLLPDAVRVTNLTTTGGGAELEEASRYRARLAMAFERIGDGLSKERYVADVLGWNARFIDVAVIRPEPGHVHIFPLAEDGAPHEEELVSLRGAFTESNTHQGDFIQVFAPVPHEFSFTLRLSLRDPDAAPKATAAVQKVLEAWATRLAGWIAPSDIIHAARSIPGVVEADAEGITFTEIAAHAWRRCTGFTSDVRVV